MNTLRIVRPTLWTAAIYAALALAGGGQASIGVSPGTGSDAAVRQEARYYAQQSADAAPTLEQMLGPFNFQGLDAATSLGRQHAMEQQLSGRGLSWTGRRFADTQQVDTWHSAAENRSVVRVAWMEGGRHSQAAYLLPGGIRRADAVPLP